MDEHTTFDKILQSALTSVTDHPRYDLKPYYRQAIYRHLGPSASTLLAMHTLKYVLPVWETARGKLLIQQRYEFTDTFVIDTAHPSVHVVIPIEISIFESIPKQAGMIKTTLDISWLHDVPEATRDLFDVMFHYVLVDGGAVVRSQAHSIEIEFVVRWLKLSTPLQAFSRAQVHVLCKELQERLPYHIEQWVMSISTIIEGVKP